MMTPSPINARAVGIAITSSRFISSSRRWTPRIYAVPVPDSTSASSSRSMSSSLVHQPQEARIRFAARDVADDDAALEQPPDRLGRIAPGTPAHERPLGRERDDIEPFRQRRAAALGHLRGALEGPLRTRVERGEKPGERGRRDPLRVEAGGARPRLERCRPARSSSARSSSAGRRASRSGSRTTSAPTVSGPQSHFCAETVRKSSAGGVDRNRADRLGAVHEHGQPASLAAARRRAERARPSRAPARARATSCAA